jgi:predicted RNA-binding Zn ribbon-like protein
VRVVGGDPALDFVNTVHDWYADPAEDYLQDVPRYLQWCDRVGVGDRASPRRPADVEDPDRLLNEVHRLRGDLREVFLAVIRDRRPSASALAGLDWWLHLAWNDLTLEPAVDGMLAWRGRNPDPTRPLKKIALSGLGILQSSRAGRLKECAAVGECGWLFIDDTKNNRRRWCSMELCGTRAKMRRYRSAQPPVGSPGALSSGS